jgi:hypothetical protein
VDLTPNTGGVPVRASTSAAIWCDLTQINPSGFGLRDLELPTV